MDHNDMAVKSRKKRSVASRNRNRNCPQITQIDADTAN